MRYCGITLIRGGQFSWIVTFFVYSQGCYFVDASVTVTKITLSKILFVEDLNSWKRAAHEYHENLATANSNDSSVNDLCNF